MGWGGYFYQFLLAAGFSEPYLNVVHSVANYRSPS